MNNTGHTFFFANRLFETKIMLSLRLTGTNLSQFTFVLPCGICGEDRQRDHGLNAREKNGDMHIVNGIVKYNRQWRCRAWSSICWMLLCIFVSLSLFDTVYVEPRMRIGPFVNKLVYIQ